MAVVWAPAVFGDNDDGFPDAHTVAVDDDARRYGSWAEWAVDAPTQTGAAPTAIPAPTLVPVVPDPSPVPEPVQPSSGSVENITCSYDWNCDTALRVFRCENGYNAYGYWRPDAVSATGDAGITQINRETWEWWLNRRGFNFASEWADPARNVAMAYMIWLEGSANYPRSFHHWNCY